MDYYLTIISTLSVELACSSLPDLIFSTPVAISFLLVYPDFSKKYPVNTKKIKLSYK